jgi:hypothetical protein
MEDFFESLSQNSAGGLLPAMNSALVNKGTTLPEAYHAYAVAAIFSKNCGGGYGYPYCFREGANYVAAAGIPAVHGSVAAVGGSHAGTVPDNYALNWVNLPLGGGPYDITLGNNSGGQFRGSVVCDTGATLTVTPFPQVVGAGDATLLANYNPAGCTSLVAVITNQAQTAANPSSCTSRGYQITVSEPAPSMAGSGMVVAPRLAGVGEVVPNPFIPILMLTAHTEASRVASARDAGVNGFIKKPISARLLFDRIANVLTDPRMFVRTSGFVGPDRRHGQTEGYAGPFRRDTDAQQAPDQTIDIDDLRWSA